MYRCKIERDEWYYTEPKHFSIVTEFDIDCDKEWLLEILSSIHFITWGIGAIILGLLGDKYGRKILLFPSTAVLLICGCISSFMPNVYLIIVLRCCIGFFIPGPLVQANILITEMVGDDKRPLAVLIPFFSLPIGYSLLALQFYYLKNWKLLNIMCTAPYIFIFAFYFFIPESFKWLYHRGRNEEALGILKTIAKWNAKEISPDVTLRQPEVVDQSCSSNSQGTAGENERIILNAIIQCFIWMTCTMMFFGLQMAASELEGSLYTNFVLLSLVQIPAILVTIVLSKRVGRKKTNLIPIFIAGLLCLGVAFISKTEKFVNARVAVGVAGKFFVSMTLQGVYIWSAEIFPTQMRSKYMGILQSFGRLGSAGSPWVMKSLKPFGLWVPFIVLGVPALLVSVLGLWLPETKTSNENGKIESEKDKSESRQNLLQDGE